MRFNAELDRRMYAKYYKAKGAHDKAVETARNFLSLGVNTQEQIAQATGLPLEEVQKLAEEMENLAQKAQISIKNEKN